jgi:hypothetical protein
MRRSLEDYENEKEQYQRPDQQWVCGWASVGKGCHIGPDNKGQCHVERECVPQLDRDRWTCNRPKTWGGKCVEGPLPGGACQHRRPPCQPVRSLLARRRAFTVWVTAAAIGAILLMLGGNHKTTMISPGELSVHHRTLEQNCDSCHSTAGESLSGLFHSALSSRDVLNQSRQCLQCHSLGEHSLQPHSVETALLAKQTQRAKDSGSSGKPPAWMAVAQLGPPIPKTEQGELSCVTCHREHRGGDFDLTQISEKRCQRCHAQPFHSFSQDHPDFVSYPYNRRSRIYFDHSTHFGRHFSLFERLMPNGKKPDGCTTCHVVDASGTSMSLRGFEESCASCHAGRIETDDVLPGVAFLALPGIDRRAGEGDDDPFRKWPHRFRTGEHVLGSGATQQLTPLMQILLSSDPDFQNAIQTLEGINLGDLSAASTEQLESVRKYTESIRRLLDDLIESRQSALKLRLQDFTGTAVNQRELAILVGERSPYSSFFDAMLEVHTQWFGEGEQPGSPKKESQSITRTFDGWYYNETDYSIRYRPNRHADLLLRTWLDVCCRLMPTDSKAEISRTLPARGIAGFFALLSERTGPSGCLKCHTVDRKLDGQLQINWTGNQHQPYHHRFTKFSHDPHLKQMGVESCEQCHVLDQEIRLHRSDFTTRNWEPNTDPSRVLTSGFSRMQRRKCATCHTTRSAGEHCLQCHRYHIGHLPPRSFGQFAPGSR